MNILSGFADVSIFQLALLAWARSQASANDAGWQALATLPARWSAPVIPLKAADFIKRGVAKGPALGAAIAAAEETWIAAGFPMDAAQLESIAAVAMHPLDNTAQK